jgi:tetratricopeptide (TPR) repeat protein
MAWPMTGLGPLHVIPYEQFGAVTFASLATNIAAIGLFTFGLWQFWKRSAVGGLLVGVTAALLPVMHILPVEFDDSYYHDRYATLAIAVACSFVPTALSALVSQHRTLLIAVASIGVFWLFVAVVNIRITLPLWSDEILLWQWVLRENPHSTFAQVNLIALYLGNGEIDKARPLAIELEKMKGKSCANCMLNLANLAIVDGDADRATVALEEAKEAMMGQAPPPRQIVGMMVATGDIRRLRGDLSGAEDAYRDAISSDPDIPTTYISMAATLAAEGKLDEARQAAEEGLALFAPDDRARQRPRIERILAAASQEHPEVPPVRATIPSAR